MAGVVQQYDNQEIKTKKACIIGGTGFLASQLVKLLLSKDVSVNTTVRDLGDEKKISHLLALQDLGDLKFFQANLTDEGSFDAAVQGCDVVFLVATPVNFASQDPENDMIKPAVFGVRNVLTACVKAKTVKRVVLTSSAAAVSIKNITEEGLVITEEDWTDVDFLYSQKPSIWGYPVSKTLAEREAWKFAKENNLNLVTVIPPLIAGPSLTPDVPGSIGLATCLLTGDEPLINNLKGMELGSGSISITHVEDVCRAHIFLAEKESASGRYICSAVNTCVLDLAKFLSNKYPQYNVPTDFGEFPSKAKSVLSSEKLVNEGFKFKYGLEQIYDSTIEYLKSNDLLKD
ncbi:anthocyanidin reductase ((2S)-flavan-3-ol-forming) isoform X1 [Beta vulgaris subsp. vulgaris]|uniref:anthocyanidin reductase ((2S)-flavan-3-ol-forming) isoform X1 n=1 Tax=Beta vulgaris subsp. vulgaris TaxID=3555 RepID=UPI0020370AE6|nr:anthocyanidin reductase ((2S)-flavan-3-ol-forming) isoform X1 [Beta vulgaris subsp. vulgaris]